MHCGVAPTEETRDLNLSVSLSLCVSVFQLTRTSIKGVSTFTDGCDLTSIYSVCAIQDISECMSLDKETRQRN